MRIVNNSTSNHLEEVKDLLSNSNEVMIASPFISLPAIKKIENWLTSGFQGLTLVTTLKEKDPDQLKKVLVLEELFRLKKSRSFRLTVRIDNQLHGKVYIGKKDVNYIGAIVSSANFTENGLENNHEWGAFINDQMAISDIQQQIMNDASIELSEKDLAKMRQWMDDNPKEDVKSPKIDVCFIDMIAKPSITDTGVTYWLKPLGRNHKPVPDTTFYGDARHRITFSKRGRPNGIKEGHIVIAYSIITMQLISVFVAGDNNERGELTQFPVPGDEKWPYYIWCDNDTPQYGAIWPKMELTLHTLREDFLRQYPKSTVLPSGNKLNALQWGSDHVRATPEFGEFVVARMKKVI